MHPLQWPLMAWKRLSGGRSFKQESNGGVSTFLFNVHFWESHKKKSNGGANIWAGKVKSRKCIYRGLFCAAWSVPIATNVCELMIKQRQKIQNKNHEPSPSLSSKMLPWQLLVIFLVCKLYFCFLECCLFHPYMLLYTNSIVYLLQPLHGNISPYFLAWIYIHFPARYSERLHWKPLFIHTTFVLVVVATAAQPQTDESVVASPR